MNPDLYYNTTAANGCKDCLRQNEEIFVEFKASHSLKRSAKVSSLIEQTVNRGKRNLGWRSEVADYEENQRMRRQRKHRKNFEKGQKKWKKDRERKQQREQSR